MMKNIEEQLAYQEKILKENGWIPHFVYGDKDTPFGINYHTHGFDTKYNHPDIQICFPLPIDAVTNIFEEIANFISENDQIQAGNFYKNILPDYEIQFIDSYESGRKVLRLIITDEVGKSDMHPFNLQFETIPHTLNNDNQD